MILLTKEEIIESGIEIPSCEGASPEMIRVNHMLASRRVCQAQLQRVVKQLKAQLFPLPEVEGWLLFHSRNWEALRKEAGLE